MNRFRHQRRIKVQQLPQEEVERFTNEDEAIMTTVFAVGAVIVGLPQVSLCLIILATGHCSFCPINGPMWRFFAMPPTHNPEFLQ